MDNRELISEAAKVRARSHSPYSQFAVGAALRTKSGRVFTGCNVENISFRLTMCAEQGAVAAAIAQGEREFTAIAVVADSTRPIVPCGGCRQVLAEFNPEIEVIMSTLDGVQETMLLSQLLPRPAQGILESKENV
jgi:cytidine deaminase